MRWRVVFSEQARTQLREIAYYLRCNVSAQYARRVVAEVRQLVKGLEDMPERYAYARNIVLKRQGFRCAVCGKYLIFYKVFPDRALVQVYGVVNGTRDYLSLVL